MVYWGIPLLAGLLITGSQVITARNPVHSVFWLVLTFIQSALVLMSWGLDFIALMTIIVYVGAIAILFLFVILMLQLGSSSPSGGWSTWPSLVLISLGIFIGTYLTQSNPSGDLVSPAWIQSSIETWSNVELIGYTLYQAYPLLFVGAGFTLLIAMVGAMVLSKVSSSPWLRKQIPFHQLQRSC